MLKRFFPVVLCFALPCVLLGQTEQERARVLMGSKVYEAAGLEKLDAAELAALLRWLEGDRVSVREETTTQVRSELAKSIPPVPVETPRGEEAFGLEQLPERVAKVFAAPDRLEARLDGKCRGWAGKTVFRLDNGQVWQQTDGKRLSYRLDDAEVILFKGTMGTYFLKPRKLNSSVRVRRVR